MCAILVDSSRRTGEEGFRTALRQLVHRGPDAPDGYRRVHDVHLGHHRLRVVNGDAAADQPFTSRSGRTSIVFNGEIYRYRETAKRHGIPLASDSDSELIVELYERLGPRMMAELDGMFAFVLIENDTGELFVARDRLGVKPLYWIEHGAGAIFSSETSAIRELVPNLAWDPVALRQYLKLRGTFGERTFYERVRNFPAGHYRYRGSLHRYWELPETSTVPDPEDRGELRRDLADAVAIRESAAVPVGCFLSGGLDSSFISALSSRASSFWSVGSEAENEFEPSQRVADYLGVPLTRVVVSDDEFRASAADMIRRRREPLLVPNEVYIHALCREAKKSATVLLSGEGADELFSGYFRIFAWASREAFSVEAFDRHYSYRKGGELDLLAEILAPYARYADRPYELMKRFFIHEHLPTLLKRLDHASMLSAVEVRCPFLEYRLFEKYWRLPAARNLSGQEGKEFLKQAATGYLPDEIIRRPKVGFPVNVRRVLAGVVETDGGESDHELWADFNLRSLGVV